MRFVLPTALATVLAACSAGETRVLDPAADAGANPAGGESASGGESGRPVPETPPNAPASCKRGVAYGYHSVADLRAIATGIGWWYNWSAKPDSDAIRATYGGIGVDFVPMVWDEKFDVATLGTQIPEAAKYLLAFNEPNFGEQASLTPTEAAALWPKLEEIAKARGMKIVSPAVNYCGGNCNLTDPIAWLDQFFEACPGCQVDYVAMHWYACSASALEWYLGQFAKYGSPLWLTEFSCGDGEDVSLPAQQKYMKEALEVLEADKAVFRYAWFAGRSTNRPAVSLLGADGQLTELGKQYVSAPGGCIR